LDYHKHYIKPFSEMSYHVQSSMAFKPNELGLDQNHGIVSSNNPILCTCMRLGMLNKVHFGCIPFLCIKSSFSIFWVSKRVFLWNYYQIFDAKLDHNILKNNISYFMHKSPTIHIQSFPCSAHEKDKLLPNQLKMDLIWTITTS
jgi:hypothetical protein